MDSGRRRWPALLALALGGFAIGLTEFVASGLLPEIAKGLLPAQYARSSGRAVADTGWVISAYALGVVVGAPAIALVTARLGRKTLVLGLLVLFVVGTLSSAVAPNFALFVVARFMAGLPHGAYFGAAGMLAATIMGPGQQAKGFAVVLSGLTAANVVGVPLVTWLGQSVGWRYAYLAIAVVFTLTFVAVLASVPAVPGVATASPRDELRAFRSAQIWLVAAVASIGFAGFFAVDSYLAPITTRLAHLSAGVVPWVLVAVGLGMTLGNAMGGWLSDRNVRRSLVLGFIAFIASLVLFALVARYPVGLFGGAFAFGATTIFLAPAMQARLISAAPDAQLMGAAVNQSAMNIGNSLGAAIGAVAIAAGLGYTSPAWIGAGLAVVGLGLALLSFRASPE